MLGSTHGTLTTDARRARVLGCDEQPSPVVHGRPAEGADVDVSGRPLYAEVPDLDRFFRPGSVAVVGASDAEGRPNTGITRQLLDWAGRVGPGCIQCTPPAARSSACPVPPLSPTCPSRSIWPFCSSPTLCRCSRNWAPPR